MLITQKPEYTRKIEEDRLSPFGNDEVLLNLADKKLSNVDSYTAHTYYNYAIVLNSHIERALACESPRMQPAVQRLCELSSLVSKSSDLRVSDEEHSSLSAFTKALLARRAADLILVHHATSSLNSKSDSEWKVCVSALSRLALHWLAACKHTTPSSAALVALEALEANSIRKHLDVEEEQVEKLLQHEECPERLADACGAACPSASSSPSRSGSSFTPTLISFIPLAGFEQTLEGAADAPPQQPLTQEKYDKCIGALAGTLENSMVMRRIVNVMRVDPMVASGSFIDALIPSLPAYPNEASFRSLYNADLTRFDLKCFLLLLTGWTRVSLSSPLSSLAGASRLLSPAPLPSSLISQHQVSLWTSLVLRAQKRFAALTEHAVAVQTVKKLTRLVAAPPVPLMGTVFYTLREEEGAEYVTELYARKIVETICCSDSSADRAIFRTPQGGMDFDADDETRLLNDASIFISECEMEGGDWTGAERTLLMCEQSQSILEQLAKVYTEWANSSSLSGDGERRTEVEKKLKDVKAKMVKESPQSDKENGYGMKEGRRKESETSMKGGKNRSPAISIEGEDLNRSSYSEYASAPSTPFKNGTILFGTETPTFHTPGGRPSLWPGAIAQRNLFLQATTHGTPSTPRSTRSSIPIVESREEEVQTEGEGEESVFMPEPTASSASALNNTFASTTSRHRTLSDAIPEEAFQLESLLKNLEMINDGIDKQFKENSIRVEAALEAEKREDERRKEEEEKERLAADEEMRRLDEDEKKRREKRMERVVIKKKEPIHPPLGATKTVDAINAASRSPLLSLPTFPLPMQQRTLQSLLQQPSAASAAHAAPPMMMAAENPLSMLHQMLSFGGPASIQSPAFNRMAEVAQSGGLVWPPAAAAAPAATSAAAPNQFAFNIPTTMPQQQSNLIPKAVPSTSSTSSTGSKQMSAFESAFMKKKEEEEKGVKHEGCICCDDDDVQDRWFAAYERVAEKNDRE